MNRKWSNTLGLGDLGLGSALRAFDSAESALNSISGVGASALGAEIWKASAGLSGVMEGIADVGGGSASSAISAAKANASLVGGGLKDIAGIGKTSLLPPLNDLVLSRSSHAHLALGALPDLTKGSSVLTSVVKASDPAGAIPKSKALGLSETMLGAGAELSAARTAASFLGAEERAYDLFASAIRSDWRSDLFPRWPQGILSGTSSGLSGWIGAADAVKNAGAWRNAMGPYDTEWLFGPSRGISAFGMLGTDLLRGALPAFDALGAVHRVSDWGLGGLLDTIGRIDLESLQRAARIREARRPRTKIGFAGLKAYDGFCMNYPWDADEFLVDHLGIEPNEDTREALWLVLKWTFERTVTWPAKWIVVDDEGAARYLRSAVYKNAKRVRRDKERPNRVWWEERDPDTKKKVELSPPTLQPDNILELMMGRSGNPADVVVPPPDDRGRVLQLLYVEGTEQDRKVVGMLIAGFDLAAVAHVVGWPEVQRFTRKAQRWRRIKLDPPARG